MAKHFLAGRGFMGQTPNDPTFCDLAHVHAYDSDGRPLESFRALAEEAIKAGTWIVFAGHEIGEGGRQTTQIPVLRELGSYLRNRQADLCVAPVAAVADHIRQHR